MRYSFDFLNSNKPIITVNENKIQPFIKFLNKFDFKIESQCLGKYFTNQTEYIFNGNLSDETILKTYNSINLQGEQYGISRIL